MVVMFQEGTLGERVESLHGYLENLLRFIPLNVVMPKHFSSRLALEFSPKIFSCEKRTNSAF